MSTYAKSAEVYDALYDALGKDYAQEAQTLHSLIREHKRSPGNALLDVACGTGRHLKHLQKWYAVEGLDLSSEMPELPPRPLRQEDYQDAFRTARLEVFHDPEGLMGRGLYLGRKPLP